LQASLFATIYHLLTNKVHEHKNSLPQHHLQGGLAYIIGKNVQVDANGSLGLNTASPDYFIKAGLARRLNKKE